MKDIIAWNALEDTNIKIGQKLKLYAPETLIPELTSEPVTVQEPTSAPTSETVPEDESNVSPTPVSESPNNTAETTDGDKIESTPTEEGENAPLESESSPSEEKASEPSREETALPDATDVKTPASSASPIIPSAASEATSVPAQTDAPASPTEAKLEPATSPVETEPASPAAIPPNTVRREYTPVNEISISQIADAFGVSVEDIRKWNALGESENAISSTVVLYLPVAEEVTPLPETNSPATEPVSTPSPEPAPTVYEGPYSTHVIQQGDTLRNIAQRYNTTVQKLIEMNQITNPDKIVLGKELKVPVVNP